MEGFALTSLVGPIKLAQNFHSSHKPAMFSEIEAMSLNIEMLSKTQSKIIVTT